MKPHNTQPSVAKKVYVYVAAFIVACVSCAGVMSPPAAAAACTAPSTNYGSATTNVSIPTTGTYRVWSRMIAPTSANNSYLLEIDGNQCFTVGGTNVPTSWKWVDYAAANETNKINVSLASGTHSVKLIGNKPDVKLDRIVMLSDPNCVPTGTGDNCNTPSDTTAPAITLTAPADGATVSGTVNTTATASDNVGVTKVEFYDNNALLGTDTNTPYTFSWNTTTTANGVHTLTAKAYDDAGNTSFSARNITVQNNGAPPITYNGPFLWQNPSVAIMDEGKNVTMPTDFLHKGERLFVSVSGKNAGGDTWYQGGTNPVRLGTWNPTDHTSQYCDVLWLPLSTYCNRAASLREASVPPGGTFHFDTYIHAPNQGGEFREYFQPVIEGRSWMTNNTGFHIYVNSTDFYDWQWLYFDAYTNASKTTRVDMNNLAKNQQVYIELTVRNSSATVWTNSGANPTRLGTQNPQDHQSFICGPGWIACNRAANIIESSVKPGQNGTFGFTIKVPSTVGEYREYLKPVIELKGWMRGDSNHIYMKVTH